MKESYRKVQKIYDKICQDIETHLNTFQDNLETRIFNDIPKLGKEDIWKEINGKEVVCIFQENEGVKIFGVRDIKTGTTYILDMSYEFK